MVRALTLCVLLALVGCQTTTKGTFCAVSHPIRLSQSTVDNLSDQEVSAVLAHNKKGAALCGWKP